MGFGDFIIMLFAKIFNVLSWPSFTLLCPLFASIRVIESGSNFKSQQCLAFWVLFSLTTYLELALAKPLKWLPLWPEAKGLATILLVIPYFGGASFVYNNFVRRCTKNILLFPSNFDGSKESETAIIVCEEKTELNHDVEEKAKKDQHEWSCGVCLVNMTSSKCLTAHLEGKKHKAKKEEIQADKLTKSVTLCKWRKPKRGWTKLNTDGSIDKDNAGFGGLLRDHGGNPICAFVSKSTEGDVFLVELWAVWRGLVLALGLGIKVIWIESDSLSVVKTIKRDQPYGPKAGSCLYHIWELLKKFDKYKLSHSWRETNRAADFLSKMVLKGKDIVLLPTDFPESLHNIIKEDAEGKIYYRG